MEHELVSRGLAFKSIDKDARRVDFVASTDAIDSWGEIVEQDWILERFKANPVILFGHNSRELPVGKATRCEVVTENGRAQLECTIEFLSEKANPKAEQVWQSICEGALRAVSVGFMPGDYRWEKRNGVEVFVLSKNTLHEISVVPIPANPEALAKMKAKAKGAAARATPKAEEANHEDRMDLAEKLAKAGAEKAVADKQLAEAQKEVAALKAANGALEASLKSTTEQRDAAVELRRERLSAEHHLEAKAEVDALVGVKIAPAERESYVELRKTSPTLFKKMVEGKPEMKLLPKSKTEEKAGKAAPSVADGLGAGDALAAAALEGAEEV